MSSPTALDPQGERLVLEPIGVPATTAPRPSPGRTRERDDPRDLRSVQQYVQVNGERSRSCHLSSVLGMLLFEEMRQLAGSLLGTPSVSPQQLQAV